MKKVYWLRRVALILSTFAVGSLITGNVPGWLKIAFPVLAIWWLMLYDEAIFERRVKRYE
jgi:hypothetical protein